MQALLDFLELPLQLLPAKLILLLPKGLPQQKLLENTDKLLVVYKFVHLLNQRTTRVYLALHEEFKHLQGALLVVAV